MAQLEEVIATLVAEFDAPLVHLAGGNSRHVSPRIAGDRGYRVVVHGNEDTLSAATKIALALL
jgi:hypothetical protein